MIQLNELVVGYDKPLLQPLSATFESGNIYGILGKSGCGKSTLLRTIAGLHKPISGSINTNGAGHIYMMHQRYTNFPWLSCVDNILIAERDRTKKKSMRELAEKSLAEVGLADYAERFPSELSGGMQQRVALARVLFVRPKFLLMDEPLSALDDVTRNKMQQLILNIHRETNNTIVMVTHSINEAEKMCNHIIKLQQEETYGIT